MYSTRYNEKIMIMNEVRLILVKPILITLKDCEITYETLANVTLLKNKYANRRAAPTIGLCLFTLIIIWQYIINVGHNKHRTIFLVIKLFEIFK